MANVDEISRGIYQIRTYDERIRLSFNQFLVVDQKPVLVHAGTVQSVMASCSGLKSIRRRYLGPRAGSAGIRQG